MANNSNTKQAQPANSNHAPSAKIGEQSNFLPGVRNKRMQSQYSTLLQPRRYDLNWLNETLSGSAVK